MQSSHLSRGAVAVAAGVVVLLALGVKAGALAYQVVIAACPLMMFVMIRGMAGGHGHGGGHEGGSHDHGAEQQGERTR